MSPQRAAGWLLVIFSAAIMGCTGDSTEYKQKIMELEKRIQKQEGELRDFAGKFAPPKDFSADIQRLEDQQERISEVLKTRVEPVNAKMEEFREWAQDTQKDREAVAKRLKALEQGVADAQKRIESEDKESAKFKKAIQALLKNNEEFGKNIVEIKKEIQGNNDKIISDLKKALPKVKDAAVADIKSQIEPIEHALGAMKTGIENDRKAIAAMRAQAQSVPMENPKEVQLIARKIKDLEEALTTQKSYLLEVGTKIHELESGLRRGSDVSQAPPGPARRRWEANRSK